jgi:DNA-binding XRE family transcriptional regulator
MNDAVVVDQIVRGGGSLGAWRGRNTTALPCRIGRVTVAVGDSQFGANPGIALGTGGVVPLARVLLTEDQATGGAANRAIRLFKTVSTSQGGEILNLGHFATAASTDSFEPSEDFSFRIYAACTSELLAPRLRSAWSQRLRSKSQATQEPIARQAAAVDNPAKDLAALLSNWPQQRLGSLFGVTRQAWREWESGRSQPRAKTRARLINVLHTIRSVSARQGSAGVGGWLETPVWPGRTTTPEDLIRDGREGLVTALTARRDREPVAARSQKMDPAIREEILDTSRIYSYSPDDE